MSTEPVLRPFIDRLGPAPVKAGFSQPDYWVWGGHPVLGEDGRYHLFVARWPKQRPFFKGYIVSSEVVRAVADTPVGPYEFQEVVLPPRGAGFWDGRMTHNPTVRRYGDRLLLFYIGATFEGPIPTAEDLLHRDCKIPDQTYATIRIGMATADSVFGPWERREAPILLPRPGKWDGTVVTNPAPCICEDGGILLYYRSNTPDGLRIGLARANDPDSPFLRVCEDPVLQLHGRAFVEDPYVWQTGNGYQMLAKDMTGEITGERHAGVHLLSGDAVSWEPAPHPKAYSRRVCWDDGTVTEQGHLERPQLLLKEGEPAYLFAATADGSPGQWDDLSRSWNMVIPLI